ncbi:DUF4350 domain-containing protein [Halorarum halophilum]|uniref:DUF4350 domain-containing protein n=1 Tax=Halorarum halophilum TaxID=2743090 RepID=A0A7D5KUG7_9EURY|nr:DUF4350 domain-containing protein [Halobaculum halophilum]QLG27440.1 DUF4350 domain-containing protein [Halobaculum halophilum]
MGVPHAVLLALVAALCLSIIVAGVTSAAAFGAYNAKWDGASQLRGIADGEDTTATVVTNVSEYGEVDPSGTVAIVLAPEEPYGPADQAVLNRFVREGGTLLVAEDYGSTGNELLVGVGASTRVDGRPLRDERRYYRSPAFPVADGVGNHPLTAGVDGITLNHGSVLTTENGTAVASEATPVANSSAYGYLDTNGNEELDQSESLQKRPVVAVESVGDGQVIVVSDPSAFINTMLDRPGNAQFVANVMGAHDRVLLDYSHVTGQPPLVAIALALQKSSVLTALVGVLGLLAVAILGSGATFWRRLVATFDLHSSRGRVSGTQGVSGRTRLHIDEAALAASLRERHPEWDEDRVDRVITAVIAHRGRGRDDE